MEFYGIKYEEYKSFNNCRPKSYQLDYNPYIQISDISLTKHQDLIARLINETINKHIKYTLSETGKNIPVLVYNERIRILLANAV